jgi:tight adherence protein B
MNLTTVLLPVALFLAIVLLLEAAHIWWRSALGPEARRIRRTLRALQGENDGALDDARIIRGRSFSANPGLNELMSKAPGIKAIDNLLQQSGLAITVARLCAYTLALGCGAGVLALLARLPPPAVVAAALAGCVSPWMFVLHSRRKRVQKIEQQLPDALDLVARAMRAGHAFSATLKMVADEAPDPIAKEFRTVFEEVNMGSSMSVALGNFAARTPNPDVRFFAIAVMIQRETGGNLTEILESIATLLRARFKLLGTVRVLSAEGRLSAKVLTLLPFGTAGAVYLANPEFMKTLWSDPVGIKLMWGALVLMVIGLFWMSRVVRVRV